MAAVYPSSVKSFTKKVDNRDPVIASEVNLLYDEVTAVETILGTTPTTISGWSGTFDQTTTVWNTVRERIQNSEYGLNEAYNNRVKITGNSTIAPNASTVGLKIKAATSATANLLELQNSSGTAITTVGKDGWILAINGGTA
jgi:hypothetical protein